MLRRMIPFLVMLAVVVALAVWLANHPGAVTINWMGWRLSTSMALLLVVLVVAVVAIWLVLRAVAGLVLWPSRVMARARARARREHAGVRALADGVAAAAVGETKRALKLARQAEKSIGDPSVTAVLTAQVAEQAGDERRARDQFNTLLARPETAGLGLRGLLRQAIDKDDRAAALELARQARQSAPSDSWTAETLFDLLVRADQLAEAETLVEEAERSGAMNNAAAGHRLALVLNERAARAQAGNDQRAALAFARRAVAADSDFADAAARLAQLYTAGDRRRRADGVLARAWKTAPSPELLRAIGDEAPLVRLYRLERLLAEGPPNPDGLLAQGETELDAKLWGQARRHLLEAARLRPTTRAYELLARVEEQEYGNGAAARDWRDKAALAPPDPAWVCGHCHGGSPAWVLACPHCGSIDRLEWPKLAGATPVPGPATTSDSADAAE